jgi:oxygen-independent coproporphyrinogen-3 oxidase
MDSASPLYERYNQPVPRYTSYPTAPHFHPGVDAGTYRLWLETLPEGKAVSLYLHIPFCAEMCWYCGCHTKVAVRYAPIADYTATLAREIALVAAIIGRRAPVGHIHWGGGTPTQLAPDDFLRLMDGLRTHFDVRPDAEIAIEADPRTLDAPRIGALAEAGVTRASLGVQDLNAHVQNAINRVQPFARVAEAAEDLRGAGVRMLNMDLMYGLPYQTEADVRGTIDQIASLRPDRLAVFGYAHVPWMKVHQKMIPDDALPGARERFRQAQAAAEALVALGYRPIGLDHFARPDDALARALDEGRLRRNFQGYTDDAAEILIGFGSSAIGQLPQGYVQNAVPFHAYDESVAEGRLAVHRGIALAPEDRLRRDVIERLMCDLRADPANLARRHGLAEDTLAAEIESLGPMVDDGLAEIAGGIVRITESGRPFMRVIAAAFDGYFAGQPARHSRPV